MGGNDIMRYRNASEILPDRLLKELQQYAPGELLYIPAEKQRRQWGASSGAKVFYEQRNQTIRNRFFSGEPLESLAEEYHLSTDTIRKIVYQ
ncbi:MAG: CD3324 family protein [Oscillospiraceae bacterium]|nr:CD3324 family protein [Oscillospiraceae bacterium]